jgi:inner membrane protein
MDPFTQGVLGATFTQSATNNKQKIKIAGPIGFLGGTAADLDVFIRSDTDPLLFLEYHRHFTHSLAFIPIGGLIVALALHLIWGRRHQLSLRDGFIFATLGYATHALLDACTSYGTLLYWPFSNARVSWNTISIIDPLFTLPLAILLGLATVKRKPLFAHLGMAWVAVYMGLGWMLRNTAQDMGREIATARGHVPHMIDAKPSFGNLLVWKVIYQTPTHYFVDAVRVGWSPLVFEGASVLKLEVARDLPWLDPISQQAKDVERFRFFSQGYVALEADYPNRIMDIRYSLLPNDINPLWSIQLNPNAPIDAHAAYVAQRRNAGESGATLWGMITAPGPAPAYQDQRPDQP